MHKLRYFLFLVLSVLALPTLASAQTPHKVIEDTTANLINVINEAKGYVDKDPQRFYRQVDGMVDPLIDFRAFSRSVMGRYGSRQYYASLPNDAARAAYKQQFERFVTTFRNGLVQTYGKGLLAFEGQKIEVQAPRKNELAAIRAGESVDVIQLIYGSADKPYVVTYKMKLESGSWKIKNVTIESINIGKVYRSQFETAMQKYGDDFAKVVDNWTVVAEDFKKGGGKDAPGKS